MTWSQAFTLWHVRHIPTVSCSCCMLAISSALTSSAFSPLSCILCLPRHPIPEHFVTGPCPRFADVSLRISALHCAQVHGLRYASLQLAMYRTFRKAATVGPVILARGVPMRQERHPIALGQQSLQLARSRVCCIYADFRAPVGPKAALRFQKSISCSVGQYQEADWWQITSISTLRTLEANDQSQAWDEKIAALI